MKVVKNKHAESKFTLNEMGWARDLEWIIPSGIFGGIDGVLSSLFVPSYIPRTLKELHETGVSPGIAEFVGNIASIGVYGLCINKYIENIINHPTNLESYIPLAINILAGVGLPIARRLIRKSQKSQEDYDLLKQYLPPILIENKKQ